MRLATLLTLLALLLTGAARAQSAWSLKGACSGHIFDNDGGPLPKEDHALKCDALVIMQIKDHTLVSFSDGDLSKPLLMFAGVPADISYPQGFTIDSVAWGDANLMKHAGWLPGDNRACVFHFKGQGPDWSKRLTEVECELADPHANGVRRAWVVFRSDVLYNIQGQQFTVEFTANGVRWNSGFRAKSEQMNFEGTCGTNSYVLDGHLRTVDAGSLVESVFQEVCK